VRRLDAKLLTAIALGALALLAAGCGDDDGGGEDESGPPLSKQDFIAQADQICAESDQTLNAAAEEEFGSNGTTPPREDQEAFISDVVAPELQSQRDQIAELSAPEEDQEQVDEILSALGSLAESAESDPAAVLDGQQTDAAQLAAEYGFQVCGN
jgi:uncharacterized protein YfcZ (UPF0381/DUF406 family)